MSQEKLSLNDPEWVWACLRSVIDPETNMNVVDMGLIYSVKVAEKPAEESQDFPYWVHIVYTLTTPACPLGGFFSMMIQDEMKKQLPLLVDATEHHALTTFDPVNDVYLELVFDPPWTQDRLSPLAKAELGLE